LSFPLDIDEDFKRELFCLVPTLLAPENLVVKEIGGAKLTCRDLLHYFKVNTHLSRPAIVVYRGVGYQGLSS
jgi:hypothetical protein